MVMLPNIFRPDYHGNIIIMLHQLQQHVPTVPYFSQVTMGTCYPDNTQFLSPLLPWKYDNAYKCTVLYSYNPFKFHCKLQPIFRIRSDL
jgi:hypothetical protein